MRWFSVRFRDFKRPDFSQTSGKRLLVVRHGGVGDLLFITPIIRKIKTCHPNWQITLMTRWYNFELFQRVPYLDRLINHAWPNIFALFTYDYVVLLDKSVECDPLAEQTNIYDLFSEKYFGIRLDNDEKLPVICWDQGGSNELKSEIPLLRQSNIRKVGIQLRAGSPVRTPSQDFWIRLVRSLLTADQSLVVFLLVERRFADYAQKLTEQFMAEPALFQRIVNMGDHAAGLPRLIDMIWSMDAVVAPDSSVAHLSAGLGVPVIGIYGPFPGELRVKYYKGSRFFNAPTLCAPCFTHGHLPCRVATEQSKSNSPCFDELNMEELARSVLSIVNDKPRKSPYDDYLAMRVNASSETSKHYNLILKTMEELTGVTLRSLNGVELGSGGAPLVPEAVSIDMARPYTKCGSSGINLKGDARRLTWFSDDSLDYLYSSHLFEDFDEGENLQVLSEWARVIRSGGHIMLLLPDQKRYERHCAMLGSLPNEHHKIPHFSLEYVSTLTSRLAGLKVVHGVKLWEVGGAADEYNFFVVLRKGAA